MRLSPIALFVYNRPKHTRQTVEALLLNSQAKASDLYIFSDAPKNEAAREAVEEVRDYIKQISGFNKVNIIKRDVNWGLANSVINGVTKLCDEFDRVIVLEDDLITSPNFLKYMNEALDLYENDEQIASISAYMYPVNIQSENDTIFLDFPMSWGWGTWKKSWELFNSNGSELLAELNQSKLFFSFDTYGPGGLGRMLVDQINGKNNSWFVRWSASLFLKQKLSLSPKHSLITNIGIDGSGVHCGDWLYDPFKTDVSNVNISVFSTRVIKFEGIKPIQNFFIKVKFLKYLNATIRLLSLKKLISKIKY